MSEYVQDLIIFPHDEMLNWLPYHYDKYIPTWHLVRSYLDQ